MTLAVKHHDIEVDPASGKSFCSGTSRALGNGASEVDAMALRKAQYLLRGVGTPCFLDE